MPLLAGFTPLVEIAIIAVLLNYLLSFFWNTRSMDLLLGLLAFLLLFAISSWLDLPVLHEIMLLVANVAVLAILIIFQPELRVALSKLSVKGRRLREMSEFDLFLEELTQILYRFSEERIGALIVLEHDDPLEEVAQKGVLLQAHFSPELLEAIFSSRSPLHDGAVLIRNMRILAAAVILPLAEEAPAASRVGRTPSMGTRHRAALGMSQQSDAIVLIVSEESGRVSIARDGVMTQGVRPDRLRGIVRSVFAPPAKKEPLPQRLPFWVRQWWESRQRLVRWGK